MPAIKFTRNYNDLSTDKGFQFEFFCDRCGNGHQTRFQTSTTGMLSDVLDTANSLLGGLFGSAADVSHRVHSAAWEKAHDDAFEEAIKELRPEFHQCKRCGHWVDEVCWNEERNLCKSCAPDLEEEYSSIQTQAAINDAREKAETVDYVKAEKFKQTIMTSCPHCGAKASGGKFCPECGQALSGEKHCTECGSKIKAGAKFCAECGAKQ